MVEVVVREVLGAYWRAGQLPFSPLLFHEIDLLTHLLLIYLFSINQKYNDSTQKYIRDNIQYSY